MAANPALVQTYSNELVPAPFANEVFVLTRPKVGFELDGVQTRSGKCVRHPGVHGKPIIISKQLLHEGCMQCCKSV